MPILIKINPPGDVNALWAAVKAASDRYDIPVTRKQFLASAEQYKRQHGVYPDAIEIADVPGIDAKKHSILVKVGDVEEIWYTPDDNSRKSGGGKKRKKKGKRKGKTKYIHKTEEEGLYTDSTGEVLIFYGKTRMKNDGWLHY